MKLHPLPRYSFLLLFVSFHPPPISFFFALFQPGIVGWDDVDLMRFPTCRDCQPWLFHYSRIPQYCLCLPWSLVTFHCTRAKIGSEFCVFCKRNADCTRWRLGTADRPKWCDLIGRSKGSSPRLFSPNIKPISIFFCFLMEVFALVFYHAFKSFDPGSKDSHEGFSSDFADNVGDCQF
jgi:hypothetical protein